MIEYLVIGGLLYLAFRMSGVSLPSLVPSGAGAGTYPAGTGTNAVGAPGGGPNDYPHGVVPGQPLPGTVTLGGKPADAGWQPGNLAGKTSTIAGLGLAGTALASGIQGAVSGGAGFAAAGTALGTAIPLIGAGIAVFTTILGVIAAHHRQALQREGQYLNSTDPAAMQALVLVAQAAIHGEINSVSEAKTHTDQIVTDWYNQVKPIQRGTWHFTGQDMSADYQKVWLQRTQPPQGAPGYSDYHAPDPCNAACVIGHFFLERNAFVVLNTVSDILAGNHGVMVLPEIPPHATQQGFPEVRMTY